ncbi:MAG: hypothetical protein H6817_08950 [Phycisphaerales bacterium]|nr:hypothetical protein [Phycisphaerales bacterium]
MNYTIRAFRDAGDAVPQYELWLRATEGLPRAWRSSLRNVQHQLTNAVEFPNCRLYAERADGTMTGYIGTHPPFEWLAAAHGPPARSLGWAIPFGFPWTHPVDAALESALHDEMIRLTPITYADFKRDIYVQRFRESWTRHIAFLENRGWRLLDRIPLIGKEIGNLGSPPSETVPVTRDDMSLVAELCQADDTAVEDYSSEELLRRYDAGWIVSDTFWRVGERGCFALEQRGQWSAVTLLFAKPEAWDQTLQTAAAQASMLGAKEIYFTIESHEGKRRAALDRHNYREVDAGVYYVRDAD